MLKAVLLCGGSALVAAASLTAGVAFADTAAPASAAEATPSVGELVVVAEKREQKIESVPVAITAFSSKQRALEGIVIFNDLADMTPGLTWTDTDDRIYIRGIGRNSDNFNNTSGVAVYYNGIYYGAGAQIELQKDDLFIASTEVDKGPQNTLHGSNADGGVVDFESARPTDSFYAEIRGEIDNYSTYRTEFAVSGPIDDHLKFRIAGNYTQQTGGFYNNLDGSPQGGDLVLGGSGQTHYLEAQLQGTWEHFDLWTLVSSGDFATNNMQGMDIGNIPDNFNLGVSAPFFVNSFYGLCGLPGVASQAQNAAACAGGPAIVPGSVNAEQYTANMFPGNNPGNVNPRDFLQEWNSINDQQRNVQVSVHATWHAPDFDVTYYGGYQQFHYILEFTDNFTDAGIKSFELEGATPGAAAALCTLEGFSATACEAPLSVNAQPQFTLFDEYDLSFSHEINITSTWNSPFQYVAGVYWFHDHWNQPVDADVEPDQPQFAHPYYNSLTESLTAGTSSLCQDNGALAGTGETLCAAPFNPCDAYSCENTDVDYDSLAAFVQGTYKFNSQWKMTGAFRYTLDHKSGWQDWRFEEFLGPNGISGLGGLYGLYMPQNFGSATPAIDLTTLAAPPGPGYPGTGPTVFNAATGYAARRLGATWGAPTGEADIDWTPDPNNLVYAKYSRGYKSGGWYTYSFIADPEVNPEYVDAFEVGAKNVVGRSLTINSDVFYYNYYGMQVPLSVNTISGIQSILYNVPLVHSYGVEIDAAWRPLDNLTVTLGYSYLSAKIAQSACVEDTDDPLAMLPGANPDINACDVPTKAQIAAGETTPAKVYAANLAAGAIPQSIVGEAVPQSTPNHVSLNALYTIPFEPGKLSLSGTFIWKDNTYDAVFNRSYFLEPSYSQVNLRATWTSANDHYTIVAFVNNLFNVLAADGTTGVLLTQELAGQAPDILTQYNYDAPRTFGLQVQYRWR